LIHSTTARGSPGGKQLRSTYLFLEKSLERILLLLYSRRRCVYSTHLRHNLVRSDQSEYVTFAIFIPSKLASWRAIPGTTSASCIVFHFRKPAFLIQITGKYLLRNRIKAEPAGFEIAPRRRLKKPILITLPRWLARRLAQRVWGGAFSQAGVSIPIGKP